MRARGSLDHFELQHLGCTPVSCGLLLPPGLTLDQWATIGRALGKQQRELNWRIGDWWNNPGHAYGDRLALVTEDDWTGPAYSTCANVASVAGRFESSRRRELLTFSHHIEVAHLPPHFADELLDWCEEPLAATGKPESIRTLREEKNRRLAQMAPRTFGSVEAETVTTTLMITEQPAETRKFVVLPAAAAPRHEPEVERQLGEVEPRPGGAIAQFRNFLRYTEAQLPADASPEVLLEAIEETKLLLRRLTKRLRQSGGGPGDAVVVNLR